MIFVTKLNGEEFALNGDLIETIVEKPDTTIQLTTSRYVIVRESMEAARFTTHSALWDAVKNQKEGL